MVGVGVEDRVVDLLGQQVVAQLAAVDSPATTLSASPLASTLGVLRFAFDFVGDLADEVVDRRLRVGDVGGDLLVDFAAGDVADDAAGEAAFAARVERVLDRRFEVGVDLELLAGQLPALAFVADLERVLQRRQQLGARAFRLRTR